MRQPYLFSGACGGLAALLLALTVTGANGADPAQALLGDSIRPVAAAPTTGPVNPHKPYISRATLSASESDAVMFFEVALKMRNIAELEARVEKGEHVSPQEMALKYEPLAKDYQAVTDWLTRDGFTIVRQDSHHLAIFAQGNVSRIAQAWKVNFARVTSEGKEYTSAVNAPSVPADIASLLIGINGLQPHIRAHRHIVRPNDAGGTAPYTPAQIEQAYQASGLYATNITGAGQTIAIVIDSFPQKSDLVAFWDAYGINQSINNITFIQAVAGTLDTVTGEETLDTEWSSAIAPAAKVRVYATKDLLPVDLDTGYQQVIDDVTNHPELGIHQLSMSYGIGEIDAGSSQVNTDHEKFMVLATMGVTSFASAGDGGATPSIDGGETGSLQADSPASDPTVTGVGGTTLKLDSNSNESSEVVWNNSNGAGGGGASVDFGHPSWQKTPAGVSLGAVRLVPDISCAADPDYAADFYYTDPKEGLETATGGTSWASPTCAGFCALINEALAHQGLASLGVLGPHIYPLIGTANFRDITSGNNATATSGSTDGIPNYTAGTGYDEASGIGAPLVLTLTETLAGTQALVGVGQQSTLVTVNQGQTATITVNASGSPVSYQWQRMAVGTTTWSNLSDTGAYSGSTTATLTVTNPTVAMSGDQFQCVVTYAAGTLTSEATTVLVVETPWTVSTLAGETGVTGLTNNTGTAAQFNYPTGLTVDSTGNVYVADLTNNVIRKVTPAGVVTTPYGSPTGASGSTNGVGNSALFNLPRDVAYDSTNNLLYVADEGNSLIRKITLSTGVVSTVAAMTTFKNPRGIAVDNAGSVYVSDSDNNVIRKITSSGTASILAGSITFKAGYADGSGLTQALFNQPIGIAVDSSKNVYVDDYGNEVVRKITPTGVVSTVAGQAGIAGCLDGMGTQALFNAARGIAVDGTGNLYVSDSYPPIVTQSQPTFTGNNLLRKITPAGVVSTLAGQAGIAGTANDTGSAAQFYNPCGVAINASGQIYVADASNNTIRLAQAEGIVSVSATLPYASANGPAPGQFTVTRTGSTTASLTVDYSVAGTAGSMDYKALTGSVTILAGASSATIAVNALPNAQATTNQTVQVTLSGPISGVMLDPTPATVTILEGPPQAFSDWVGNYPISSLPGATPENDGTPDLLKYFLDINPAETMSAADRAALPTVGMTTIGNTDYLTLTYREFVDETGVVMHVQTSFDLQSWMTVTNPTIIVTGLDSTTQDPIMQVQIPMMGTPQFIRLNLTQP